ncbi:MAG TPA: DUF2938 domain-containing protein [Afifellaceae bacterium]|nr:DUF2938 domain-containing protein [Afifellaceae bacterium]
MTYTARVFDAPSVLQEDELVTEEMEVVLTAVLIGIGGTVILDLWSAFMQRVFNVPATNWAMVGRWVGHMPAGRFVHENIGKAAPVSGELAIGWIVHYVIGIAYGLLLVGLWGAEWLREPTLLPPMILALGLLVAPYFIMMPGMGSGIAGAKTPKPNVTRLKSIAGHSVFGLGMHVTALMIEAGVGRIPAALAGSLN